VTVPAQPGRPPPGRTPRGCAACARPGQPDIPNGIAKTSGYGGQKLFVFRESDLVAVFFGCTADDNGGISYECGKADVEPELVSGITC